MSRGSKNWERFTFGGNCLLRLRVDWTEWHTRRKRRVCAAVIFSLGPSHTNSVLLFLNIHHHRMSEWELARDTSRLKNISNNSKCYSKKYFVPSILWSPSPVCVFSGFNVRCFLGLGPPTIRGSDCRFPLYCINLGHCYVSNLGNSKGSLTYPCCNFQTSCKEICLVNL